MSPEITELDATTVERIAAGEVIERPASAVKELVENALDAGAERIEVAVDAGGTERIRVSDDGHGMSESALRMAVREHTTSKIADVADLEAGIGTLGFRGEALHAIGAVSRLTIRSRPPDAERGTELVVDAGTVESVAPVGCPPGTVVEVTDLFGPVPARRAYLRTDATEFDHVNRIVTGYALANPAVAVTLTHDGRETFATSGMGDLRDAVLSVYGRAVATAMLPVDAAADTLPDGPLAGVAGLVSHPETTRSTREYVTTFVNDRYVTVGSVREAVLAAYGHQLAPDRFPFAVLGLSVPPDAVDVNVHPRKLEVRFTDAAAVRSQVEAAVESALLEAGLVRSGAPRGRSAPTQTAIDPASTAATPAGRDSTDEEPTGAEDAGATTPASGGSSSPAAPADAPSRVDPHDRRSSPAVTLSSTQHTLADEPVSLDHAFDRLPSMRILGQYRETYLVGETADGLVLVDQHAADERINYERLRARLDGAVTTQQLADPVRLELTAREAALFAAKTDALAQLGFEAERVDDRTVELRSVPGVIADAADPSLLRDVLAGFAGGDPAATVEATADDLLADLACYPAVTANTALTAGTVTELLAALDDCENPYACPHGRPVLVELADREIEARFERDYPGHGGRRPE